MIENKNNYYNEIKDKLIQNDIEKKIREYRNNQNDLTTYYEVGKLLSDAGKHYGESIIKNYAIKLSSELGRKYSDRLLRSMRQLYLLFEKEKWKPVVSKLTWSHFIVLMTINDRNEMHYYMNQCIIRNLSKRQLQAIIKTKEYERLSDKTKIKLINNEKEDITDFIKEPIILNKHTDYEKISEIALKKIILNDLDNFLKQLGNGFCYLANEYKIKIGNNYNYIDFLLFNIIFNCYVVVELKINKLIKQDIGQIEVYMNYINEKVKNNLHSKTIGIIVCRENNKYLIKYASDSRIHVTTYEFV